MTAHIHDPATHADGGRPHPAYIDAPRSSRPRWLLPGLVIGLVLGGLVVAGAVPLSTVVYAGLFGGMILMHVGGHGHGSHGSHDSASQDRAPSDRDDLSLRSPGSQPAEAVSARGLEERADRTPTRGENANDDQHGPHGCH